MEIFADGQAAPTLSTPARLFRVTSCFHGTSGNDNVNQVKNLNVGFRGRLLTDYGDGDIGMTAIDVPSYAIEVTLDVRDSTKFTSHVLAAELMRNGVADLVSVIEGISAGPNRTLTLKYVKFTSFSKNAGRDWTGYSVRGVVLGRSGAGSTNFSLTGGTLVTLV